MAIFRGKIGEKVGRYWPPTNSFYFWGFTPLCKFGENRQRNATARVMTHGQTHTHTDRQTQTASYSYGADNHIMYSYQQIQTRRKENIQNWANKLW